MTEPPTAASPVRPRREGFRLLGYLALFLSFWFFLLAGQEGCYRQAHRIRGVVIEKGSKTGTSGVGRGGSGTRGYRWVRYRFTTPAGETKTHVDTDVLPGAWRELREGGPVDIEYMPSLADSRVVGQKASATTYLAIAVGLLVAGLAARRRSRRPVAAEGDRDPRSG
jgi:hypothetical protein